VVAQFESALQAQAFTDRETNASFISGQVFTALENNSGSYQGIASAMPQVL
jgi:hypothetical protein